MAPPPKYEEQTEKLKKFLQDFEVNGELKYFNQLQRIANRQQRVIEVSLEDVEAHRDPELASFMRMNTRRYQALLGDAIDALLPEPDADVEEEDVLDVLLRQRVEVREGEGGVAADPGATVPSEIKRRFEVRIVPGGEGKASSVREVGAGHIGQLVTVRAMVARTSDVKPLARVVTYTCEECGFEAYQEVTGRSFMPLDKCRGPQCVQYNSNSKLLMQTRGSKFCKFQELKVQELPEQVPTGQIPRMMTVHLLGELTRACGPGDEVVLSGVFLPTPYTGYRAMRAGLTADTFLEASACRQAKAQAQGAALERAGPEVAAKIRAAAGAEGTYEKLAGSIAPEIFGHEDVKKALLLQLVGANNRQLGDGLRIRGDLHVCLMGDPGVAKSQLLKHIAKLAPRGVYTTGKGSSGVGLTASVVKDSFTGELMLEGGALVLADEGVCCIDEFDKMEESDRTAIHEVMEQQTVSIAKAGITTSLNARTAVLAAANPMYGRYNTRRSPAENINLPQALLSRFDVLFLLMDRVNATTDFNLAKHVTHVHRHSAAPTVQADHVFDSNFLRTYIAEARQVEPHVPGELSEYVVGAYVSMRSEEDPADDKNYFFTTARTLLSILRLAQALARLRFSWEVVQGDVDEAMRLMYESKRSIYDDPEIHHKGYDPTSTIFDIAKNLALAGGGGTVRVAEVENRAVMKGFTRAQLAECLQSYQNLNVWQLENSGAVIRFVDTD